MRDVKQLHPVLQAKILELQQLCVNQGLPLGISECLRTVAEQDALYAQGRTKPGNRVTNARGSSYSSQHQWGIAFDFFKNVPGHAFDDNAFFRRVGALAKSIGLGWGGDWRSPVDMPHVYLPDWGSTTTKLKQLYGTPDKFMLTWKSIKPEIHYKEEDYPYVYDYGFYKDKYNDLLKAFGNERQKYIDHFVIYGMKEGRQASPVFNPIYYRSIYKDLNKAFGDDTVAYYRHYIQNGVYEKRRGSITFDPIAYYNRYQDLRVTFRNDARKYVEHYIKHGFKEHRLATNCKTLKNPVNFNATGDYKLVYDYNYYIRAYADIRKALPNDDVGALEHFVAYGMNEGRQAIKDFNVRKYRSRYKDLQKAFGNNLKAYYLHYIKYGFKEGRSGK